MKKVMFIQRLYAKLSFGVTRRKRFYETMELLMREGRDMAGSIIDVHKLFEEKNDPRKYMTRAWLNEAEVTGMSLKVMKGWVPTGEASVLIAGEESNNPQMAFNSAGMLATAKEEQMRVVKQQLGTIGISLVMLSGLLYFLYYNNLKPAMLLILPRAEWPIFVRGYDAIVCTMIDYGWFFLPTLAGIGFLVSQSLSNWRIGRIREMADALPPWSIYKEIESSSFLIGLGCFLKQGKPLDDAIRLYRRDASPYTRSYIDRMMTKKSRGVNEADAMDVGLFDDDMAFNISAVGRAGGKGLQQVLTNLGADTLKKAPDRMNTKAAVVKYGMMVIILAFLMGSIASFGVVNFKNYKKVKAMAQEDHISVQISA